MANSTIPNLVAVSVPALTDLFGVRQSGDTRDKKLTAAQLLSLGLTANGTPLNLEVAFWLDANTINHDSNLQWNTANLQIGAASGKFRGSNSASGAIENSAASSTNPTLIPRVDDPSTGIGAGAIRNVNIICDGDPASTWQHTTAANNEIRWFNRLSTGISASVTQSQGNGLLNGGAFNRIDTVANVDDVVTLPAASSGGQWMTLVNRGANRLQIFPTLGDAILPNAVNVSITLDVNKSITFMLLDTTNWVALAEPAGAGGGDVTKVGTPVDNQVGVWTGDGTIEGDSEFLWDGTALTVGFVNAGPQLLNEVATDTNPTIVPTRNDPDTGIGHDAADRMAIIAGGVTVAHVEESAGTPKFIIDPNDAGAGGPELAFGAGADTGLRESANVLTLILGGISKWGWDADLFVSITATGAGLLNEAASATNPTFVPNRSDLDSGIGQNAVDQVSVIAGGVELLRAVEVVGANQLIVSPGVIVDDAVTPVLAFGDGDTGFYENSDDIISVSCVGVRRWFFSAGSFGSVSGSGPAFQNEVPSAINPTINADSGDSDTGIGHNADDQISLIGGGVEIARAQEVVGANQFIIAPGVIQDNAAAPSLAFGDGDTGFYENFADTIKVTLAGVARWTFSADRFVAVAGNGPSLQNEASTATNPTLIPALGDVSTGIGGVTGGLNVIVGGVNAMQFDQAASVVTIRAEGVVHGFLGTVAAPSYSFRLDANTGMYSGGAGSDELKFSAGGVEALSLNELNSGVIQAHQANVAITAFATGGQASATQLDESYNVITTVATTGDSVKLPPVFAVNSVVYIKNDGANAADVFPATGDNLGAGLNTAVSLAAGASVSFIATVASSTWTQWIVSAGGGGGDVTKVGTPVNNQIGVWTGDGTIEGDANLIWDGSKLDITTGRIELPGGTAAAPPIGFQIDTGTGIYRVSNNNFGIASGGLHSVNWLRQTGQIVQTNSLDTGFTASTTQTQGNGNIFSSYTVVSTVANANDVVTAMIALAGKRLTIYNDGANILQVFPSSGDDIGAGVNSSITIAVGASKSWIANDGTTWLLIGSAP